MDHAKWNGVVTDDLGKVVPMANVTVRRTDTGALARIYTDREGATPKGNPFQTGQDGSIEFFAKGGAYTIIATSGGLERRWSFVPIGTAQEFDIDELAQYLNSGVVYYQTKAQMSASSPSEYPAAAVVLADPVGANNGYYTNDGSGWLFGRPLPDSITRATIYNNSDVNAPKANISSGVNPSSPVLFFVDVSAPNTSSVTLTIDGVGTGVVLNASGNPLVAGEWLGRVMLTCEQDGRYRMVNDPSSASAASQFATDAANSASNASDSADRAEQAVSSVGLPIIDAGDSGKALVVNSNENGYELVSVSDDVGIYDTKAAAEAANIPVSVNAIRLNGGTTLGDGNGGLYADIQNGSNDTISSGGRVFSRVKDVGASRISFDYLRPIKTSYEVTVGAGGDFATINAALMHLSQSYPTYLFNGFDATIKLKAGFVMNESVILRNGIDMGWVRIIGEDDQTTINRSALNTEIYPNNFAAFGAAHNCVLPVIGQLFEMDNTGTPDGRHGVFLSNKCSVTISPEAGVLNAGDCGLALFDNSSAVARNTLFTGAGKHGVFLVANSEAVMHSSVLSNSGEHGAFITDGSKLSALDLVATNCGQCGVYVWRGSSAMIVRSTLTGAGDCGLKVHHNGNVTAYNSDFSGALGEAGVYARHACLVDVTTSTINDCNIGVYGVYKGIINADNCTILRAKNTGVVAMNSGEVTLEKSIINDAVTNGVNAYNGGIIYIREAEVKRAGASALRASHAGQIYGGIVDCTLAGNYAAEASSSAVIRVYAMTMTTGNETLPALNDSTTSPNGAQVWGSRAV